LVACIVARFITLFDVCAPISKRGSCLVVGTAGSRWDCFAARLSWRWTTRSVR